MQWNKLFLSASAAHVKAYVHSKSALATKIITGNSGLSQHGNARRAEADKRRETPPPGHYKFADNIADSGDRRSRRSVKPAPAAPAPSPATPVRGRGRAAAKTPVAAKSPPPTSSAASSSKKTTPKKGRKESPAKGSPTKDDEESRGLFAGKVFVLTSANRSLQDLPPGAVPFKKNELRSRIVERGGEVVDDILVSISSFILENLGDRCIKHRV